MYVNVGDLHMGIIRNGVLFKFSLICRCERVRWTHFAQFHIYLAHDISTQISFSLLLNVSTYQFITGDNYHTFW